MSRLCYCSLVKYLKKVLPANLRILKINTQEMQKDQITQLQNNPTSLIDSKLTLVTEKKNAESERKLKEKKL